MAYDNQRIDQTILVPTSLADAANIAASRYYVGSVPIIVRAVWATVVANVATATSTATYKYRPTPGSDTGATVSFATIVIPVATGLAGKSFYKYLTATSPVRLLPGSELILSFSGGSGAGGQAAYGISYEMSWDTQQNNANAVLSA
jgi:hypothetical protein